MKNQMRRPLAFVMHAGNHRRGSGARGLETFQIAVVPLGIELFPTVVTVNEIGIRHGDELGGRWLVIMVISQRGKFIGEMAHQFGASFAFKNGTFKVLIEAWVQGKLEVLD
jgi:hypothetical protein